MADSTTGGVAVAERPPEKTAAKPKTSRQKPIGVEKVDVTPELAREWLGFNTHNRNLREQIVHQYAQDMRADCWKWNGEAIKFAIDGALLDGQHRLAAIIEAGVSVPMLVVVDLAPLTQETMDSGVRRKFSDALALRGETNVVAVASITRAVATWEAGYRRLNDRRFIPTNAQLFATLERHPWLRDIAKAAIVTSRGCGLPTSVIGLCWWLFGQKDADDAEHFFARLADGQGLVKGMPIYELRETVDGRNHPVRGERSTMYLTAITIKAWNAFRAGEAVGVLRFRSGGTNPERFPEPK